MTGFLFGFNSELFVSSHLPARMPAFGRLDCSPAQPPETHSESVASQAHLRALEARQGWQGRGFARVTGDRVEGRLATPAGSRVAKKMTGSLFDSKNHHTRRKLKIGLEPSPSQ